MHFFHPPRTPDAGTCSSFHMWKSSVSHCHSPRELLHLPTGMGYAWQSAGNYCICEGPSHPLTLLSRATRRATSLRSASLGVECWVGIPGHVLVGVVHSWEVNLGNRSTEVTALVPLAEGHSPEKAANTSRLSDKCPASKMKLGGCYQSPI